jgi:hypothetical protein
MDVGKVYKLYLWCNQSFGDSLITVPLVERLIEKYGKNLDIVLGCYKTHAYLFMHFPIKILYFDLSDEPIHRNNDNIFYYSCPADYVPIFTVQGQFKDYEFDFGYSFTWQNIIKNFNRQAKFYKLSLHLEEEEMQIRLPSVELDEPIRKNAVMVENGRTRGNPNKFHFDMNLFATEFPHLNFYCIGKPDSDLPNIIDCSSKDLIYLQSIVKQCDLFMGKGSGPFFITCVDECKEMPKAVFGFNFPRFQYIWDKNSNLRYYEGDNFFVRQWLEYQCYSLKLL